MLMLENGYFNGETRAARRRHPHAAALSRSAMPAGTSA
jgi:hypothetical protein